MNPVPIAELNGLLTKLITSAEGISDLFFVAGKPPQAEIYGKLVTPPDCPEPALTGERVQNLAYAIIGSNERLVSDLAKSGSCDCSHSLEGVCRFRVNIYRQLGNHGMVLRRLSSEVPTMERLKLAPVFHEIIKEKNGLVFITGGTGSGKTTTLAALLNEVNRNHEYHVVTLEDPVEFLHPQLKCLFSQREMGRDFYNFPDGLRAALRQAPKIILVGEIRDRETMEIALTAGETGHVVYSTLHTISAGQTINRILGMFSKEEEEIVRERLAGSLRYVVSQRLVPKKEGGRLLMTELMGSNLRTREAIMMGESETRRFSDIIEAGGTMGWHSFEQSLAKAFEEGLITDETALLYSVNKQMMYQRVDAIKKKLTTVAPETHGLKMATPPPAPKPAPRPSPPPAMPPAPASTSTAPAQNPSPVKQPDTPA